MVLADREHLRMPDLAEDIGDRDRGVGVLAKRQLVERIVDIVTADSDQQDAIHPESSEALEQLRAQGDVDPASGQL